MSKPIFKMRRDVHNGAEVYYETSGGYGAITYFSAPPESIDHVDLRYLQGRLNNVTTSKQVEYIKREYKSWYKQLFGDIPREEIKFAEVPFEVMMQCDGDIRCECWVLSNSRNKYGVDLKQPMLFNEFLRQIGTHLTPMNCKTVLTESRWFVIDDDVQVNFYMNKYKGGE